MRWHATTLGACPAWHSEWRNRARVPSALTEAYPVHPLAESVYATPHLSGKRTVAPPAQSNCAKQYLVNKCRTHEQATSLAALLEYNWVRELLLFVDIDQLRGGGEASTGVPTNCKSVLVNVSSPFIVRSSYTDGCTVSVAVSSFATLISVLTPTRKLCSQTMGTASR